MNKFTNCLPWVVIILMSSIFVMVNSNSTSPLFWGRGLDSSIFQYMGYSMLQGKIPYTDLFDHKGLLLYWINALGYLIHSELGIMLLQILNLSLTMMLWFRTLAVIKEEWMKYVILILSLLGLCAYYEFGNLTEEWSLLLISYPIMTYFESKKNNNILSDKQLFAIGVCLGAISIIRPNNMAPVLGMLLYCFIEALCKKEYQYIERAIKWICLGIIIFPLLACIYMFIMNGLLGIDDMFYATILFNIDYTGRAHLGSHLLFIYKAMLPMLFILPFIRGNRRDVLVLVCSFILTALSLGKSSYSHYLMVFIPLLVASFACINSSKLRYVAFIVLALVYSKTVYRQFYWSHVLSSEGTAYTEAFNKVIAPIPESKRNEIWNMGGGYIVEDFMHAHLVQSNRILLPFQMSISDRLYNEESEQIQKVKPEYVIYALYARKWQNDGLRYHKRHGFAESDSDLQFVLNNYELLATADRPDGTQLFCYHLKKK